eukprot:CAMPEP_0116857312 /NCGR_PEP_ID=MMETSP0418-20121206/20474_1 /TAXON_ID=1158023 /ORGANISM="Astrosyne radiata, Strain 13vi08-1A" /LENGTH=226 /DNA_ID=CAMNT_0004490963 /DNA_START=56 /DNA_END=737 /DNA_ORIENTATION=+
MMMVRSLCVFCFKSFIRKGFGKKVILNSPLFLFLIVASKASDMWVGYQTDDVESGGGHFLSSENKNLGSGSGQQIVTWIPDKAKTSALWIVREAHDEAICDAATPITCGSKIRLVHVGTKKCLHTHGIPSPLSRQQEITGFGEDGVGDTGDDWKVECSTKVWMRDQKVRLRHVDTGKYLGGSANVKFTQQNCGHSCPILHHLEAFGRKQSDDYSLVKVEMGVLLNK